MLIVTPDTSKILLSTVGLHALAMVPPIYCSSPELLCSINGIPIGLFLPHHALSAGMDSCQDIFRQVGLWTYSQITTIKLSLGESNCTLARAQEHTYRPNSGMRPKCALRGSGRKSGGELPDGKGGCKG